MKKILSIAGSDSSGGAGIQADIKTIMAHDMYAMSAVTALTAQNTLGVKDVMEASPEFVEEEIDCIFEDIRPDAVKTGMVSNAGIIKAVVRKLKEYKAENIVVDPVMVSTSGCELIERNAMDVLINELLTIGTVITPNIPEAEKISGIKIEDRDDMVKAAEMISRNISGVILIKGGHLLNEAADLMYCGGKEKWFVSERIDTKNTHGTGCTLSSAIACNLAAGKKPAQAIEDAKAYLTGALINDPGLGHGCGPVNHNWVNERK